jgi:hypothetical protein
MKSDEVRAAKRVLFQLLPGEVGTLDLQPFAFEPGGG